MLRAIAKALFASRAWILSIAFLAAVWAVVESSHPFQECVKEIYYNPATENFEKSISSVSVAFDVYRVCLGQFTHDNAEAIIAAFTILLALSTIFLWVATRDLVSGTEKTAKAQLRAYVHVERVIMAQMNDVYNPIIQVTIKNYGQTPAYRVTNTSKRIPMISPREQDFNLDGVEAGELADLGPTQKDWFNSIYPISIWRDVKQRLSYKDGVPLLSDKKEAFYVFGRFDYFDAFEEPHKTEFRFRLLVDADGIKDKMSLAIVGRAGNRTT